MYYLLRFVRAVNGLICKTSALNGGGRHSDRSCEYRSEGIVHLVSEPFPFFKDSTETSAFHANVKVLNDQQDE